MDSCLTLFLGGTVGESRWRENIIPFLEHERLRYFNPVVDNWDSEAIAKEYQIKHSPTTVEAYIITKEMKGVFSIAEAVDASNKKPDFTIFMIDPVGFSDHQLKSLKATEDLIRENRASIANSLEEVVYLFKGIEIAYRAKRISVLARKKKLS